MKTQAIKFGLSAAVVLVAAAVYLTQYGNEIVGDPDRPSVSLSAPVATDTTAFAKSLDGTVPSGSVRAAGSELVLEPGLIDRFEYYLTTTGERTFADIKTEIERNLAQELNLNPRALIEAMRLFKAYMDFKHEAESLPLIALTHDNAFEVAFARMEGALVLRARYFTPTESNALFGLSDVTTLDSLARLEVANNKQLSPAQKKERLAELDAKLPEQVREWRAPQTKMDALLEAENNARARGASPAELLAARTEIVGEEAAKNMAATDLEEANWQRRLASYKLESERISTDTRWTQAERQLEVQRLRERTFNESDRKRLEAFE